MRIPYLIKSSARPTVRLCPFSIKLCYKKDAVEWLGTNKLCALNISISGNLSDTHNIFPIHIS
jgi:hypothetical protein